MAKYAVVCQLSTDEVKAMRRFVCIVCGFVYETVEGMPEAGLEHGAGWAEVPMDWQCPDRGGAKKDC